MNHVRTLGAAFAVLGLLCAAANAIGAEAARPLPVDAATLARIRDAAMSSDWAWQRLAKLTDTIGPRISGSPQLSAAVTQVADDMRSLGARVTLQPVRGSIVLFPVRFNQRLADNGDANDAYGQSVRYRVAGPSAAAALGAAATLVRLALAGPVTTCRGNHIDRCS